MKYGLTSRERAESIVFRLDEYLRECFVPTDTGLINRRNARGFLVLALEIALEEAGTQSMALSLREKYDD